MPTIEREGQAVHGEVRAGSATIFLHAAAAEHRLESPLAADVANSGLIVQVDDVDAHFEHARAAGVRIDSEPVDQPYGQRSTAREIPKDIAGGFSAGEKVRLNDAWVV